MRHGFLGALLLLANGTAIAAEPAQGSLTFEDRVRAQAAIERVYWNHRIWPNDNPQPKPPLSSVMGDSDIRSKVDDYLRKSNALETWWQRPITGEQLQAEMERMAKGSRDPRLLHELFSALGNDPLVIAETLARQTLADRLIRGWQANDSRFHSDLRARVEAALRTCSSVDCMKSMGGEYHETTLKAQADDAALGRDCAGSHGILRLDPDEWKQALARLAARLGAAPASLPLRQLGGLEETAQSFSVIAVLTKERDELLTASIQWPKQTFDSWWSAHRTSEPLQLATSQVPFTLPNIQSTACTSDAWSSTFVTSSVISHTAVWTGTEMLVWRLGRYNPSTDTWTAFALDATTPVGIQDTVIWSGTEMIVWGGGDDTGGRYNPTTDTWMPISTGPNVPSRRAFHTAVWTGTQMIVWGGSGASGALATGASYDPSTDGWKATSTGANAPSARMYHTAVWTGTEMIVWGGKSNGPAWLNSGGRYNPSTDTWIPTSTGPNLPVARVNHTAIWTGSEMVIWGGGDGGSNSFNTGGRYNPASDSWATTSIGAGVPTKRANHTAVWTGTQMLVWGGYGTSGHLNTGSRYSPNTNSWSSTSTVANVPAARYHHMAIWTGTEMIVWGGNGVSGELDTGGRYNAANDTWIPTSSNGGNVPSVREQHTAVWTGTEMIIWGGFLYDGANHFFANGGRYSAATDSWTVISTGVNAPSMRANHTAVWSGTEMLVWGGSNNYVGLSTGGRYNPSTDTWLTTSTGTNVPTPRYGQSGVWTGTELIVWGGRDENAWMNSGGRYDPSADRWVATSTGIGAPSGRDSHTAVWTGTEMIVWGGEAYDNGAWSRLNSGSRYRPDTNNWAVMSAGTNVPTVRANHTAVWTGTEMIIWGGISDSFLNDGGRYNPSTDSWIGTSTGSNVPTARFWHTAIWTGSDMLIWGGNTFGGSLTNSGGRYNPTNNGWAATSTVGAVPIERQRHSAIWTDKEMIVWGGLTLFGTANSGGRYCACPDGRAAYRDADGDGYGDLRASAPSCDGTLPVGYVADNTDCDDADADAHPDAIETCNSIDDNCDGQIDENISGIDSDGDGRHNACDNCLLDFNPSQSDSNHDGEGDVCDLDDGLIYVYSTDKNYREWQAEAGYTTWNSYRGSLAVLRATGQYTQAPSSNPLAARDCGVSDAYVFDALVPSPGEVAFNLVTGVAGGIESSLGTNSAGVPRVNANPCP